MVRFHSWFASHAVSVMKDLDLLGHTCSVDNIIPCLGGKRLTGYMLLCFNFCQLRNRSETQEFKQNELSSKGRRPYLILVFCVYIGKVLLSLRLLLTSHSRSNKKLTMLFTVIISFGHLHH